MNKILIFLLTLALSATFFSGCGGESGNIWDERPKSRKDERAAHKKQREHLRYVLSRVVLIRMNTKGQICIGEDDSVLLSPIEFAVELGKIGKETPGKPVLFFYDDEAALAAPKVHAFIIRECRRANLGHIYTEVPDEI